MLGFRPLSSGFRPVEFASSRKFKHETILGQQYHLGWGESILLKIIDKNAFGVVFFALDFAP